MGKGFPHETPNPSYVTQRDDAASPSITTSETVLSTAPAVKGGDVPKKIHFSAQLNPDGAQQSIIFRCYRDGVQITAGTDVFREGLPATTDTPIVSMHWVDETPGKGDPVYEVRAVSTVDGTTVAAGRRITVHNL